MMTSCVIIHKDDNSLYWQRGGGWGDARNSTVFTVNDMHKLPLPPHGEWVKLEEPTPLEESA